MAEEQKEPAAENERDIRVVMLGPRGVGKTSLLATMYATFKGSEAARRGFSIEPLDDDQYKILKEKHEDLRRLEEVPEFCPADNMLEASQFPSPYDFAMRFKDNEDQERELRFIDTPGEYTEDLRPDMFDLLADAGVVINVIDASVMMEMPDLSDRYNGHSDVHRLLIKAFSMKPEMNRLVLFVLTKCETYLKAGRTQEMRDTFDRLHRQAIQVIETNEHLVGRTIAVETTGCLSFSRYYQRDDGEWCFSFTKTGMKFLPRAVDVPLFYAGRFALAELRRGRFILHRWWREIFGWDKELRTVCEEETENGAGEYVLMRMGNASLLD